MNLDDFFNSNPFLTTVIGDLNPKSNKLSDGDRLTIEGSKTDFLTSQFEVSQIITSQKIHPLVLTLFLQLNQIWY